MRKANVLINQMVRRGLMLSKPKSLPKEEKEYSLADVINWLEMLEMDRSFVKEYGDLPGFDQATAPATSWIAWHIWGGKQWWNTHQAYAKGWAAKATFNKQLAETQRNRGV